jgi:hypothetical protein
VTVSAWHLEQLVMNAAARIRRVFERPEDAADAACDRRVVACMAVQQAFAQLGIESCLFAESDVIRIRQPRSKATKRPPRRRTALEQLRSGRATLN